MSSEIGHQELQDSDPPFLLSSLPGACKLEVTWSGMYVCVRIHAGASMGWLEVGGLFSYLVHHLFRPCVSVCVSVCLAVGQFG